MMKTREAHPGIAVPERAKEPGANHHKSPDSAIDSTINLTSGQAVHIADLLSHGAENGQTIADLERLTGWKSREIRKQIERERRSGMLILADNRSGYFLASDPAEVQRFTRSMRHRVREMLLTVRAIEKEAGLD